MPRREVKRGGSCGLSQRSVYRKNTRRRMATPGRCALAAVLISANVVTGSVTGMAGCPSGTGGDGAPGVPDHAHDRVGSTRDHVEGQVGQRVRAGQADDEQPAARREQRREPGQGVIEVQPVQHGHHRDQVRPATDGRRIELD